jgi:hypothetical protein
MLKAKNVLIFKAYLRMNWEYERHGYSLMKSQSAAITSRQKIDSSTFYVYEENSLEIDFEFV